VTRIVALVIVPYEMYSYSNGTLIAALQAGRHTLTERAILTMGLPTMGLLTMPILTTMSILTMGRRDRTSSRPWRRGSSAWPRRQTCPN
jgi:hypothetical protein